MLKRFALSAALLAFSVTSASAQMAPGTGGTGTTCSLTGVITGFTATNCIGFFSGNLFNNPGLAAQNTALNTLLGTTGVTYTPGTKQDVPNSANIAWAGTPLTGLTVLGLHFGNDASFGGDASAFYVFNFGSNVITSIPTAGIYRSKQSSITVYSTGGASITSTVPEPSTYALMAAGLVGLFGVARRRNRRA
jgi:hypothetical protein